MAYDKPTTGEGIYWHARHALLTAKLRKMEKKFMTTFEQVILNIPTGDAWLATFFPVTEKNPRPYYKFEIIKADPNAADRQISSIQTSLLEAAKTAIGLSYGVTL